MSTARRHAAGCLADDVASDFLHGRLEDAALGRAQAHLAGCTECRQVIAQAAQYLSESGPVAVDRPLETVTAATAAERPPVARPPSPSLPPGARVGRYVVESVTGSGGMSVVYAARDPHLERRVALKVVRPNLSADESDSQSQLRLLREARAMAQLSHPNVVSVFDTGTFGDQVFIAMELIDGQTVRRWLRAETRPWSRVMEVFTAAGRGVAHAHASGLVHRDFKPENVLIGSDGRVRVSDFGLARPASGATEEGLASDVDTTTAPAWYATSRLTMTGVLAGTPAYMAPEQLLGHPPDPRTDQFSFCVALHEALYGVRPFAGRTLDKLADQILLGAIVDLPPSARRVPEWVRPILLRGLSVSPEARYESMEALLAALSSGPRKRLGLRVALSAAVVIAIAASVAALRPGSEAVANAPAAPPPPVVVAAPRPAASPPGEEHARAAPEPPPTTPPPHEERPLLAAEPPPTAPPPHEEHPHLWRRARRARAARATTPAPAPVAVPPRRPTSDDDLLP